jgi:hypothetical protein
MTEACRIYHHAVIAQQTGGRGALLRTLASASSTKPAAAGVAASVLATTFAASAVGMRSRDPGFPARLMKRQLGLHLERRHRAVAGL